MQFAPNRRILGYSPPPPESPADAPSLIKRTLRPAPESLDIFPAHVAGDTSDRRHWLAAIQRKVLYGMKVAHLFGNLVGCMARPVPAGGLKKDGTAYETGAPGKVQLHQYGQGLGFAWLKKCGNPLLCFCCAPKIRYERAQEVKKAAKWALSQGMSLLFVTFTAPHYADGDPREQVSKFNEARRKFFSGRWGQNEIEKTGYAHAIRALEVTMTHPAHGIGNGAHVHDHELTFFEHPAFTEAEVVELWKNWIERWRICLEQVGIEIRDIDAFYKYGLDIKLPYTKCGSIVDDESLQRMADYVADKSAVEISPGIFGKKGREIKHINHFEYFALALTQYPAARPYMVKLMLALKGRSFLRFTKGFKNLAGIEEKTDEELLQEHNGECIREYDTAKEWKYVDGPKWQRRYIRAMEDDGGAPADAAERMMRIILAGFDPLTGEQSGGEPPPG